MALLEVTLSGRVNIPGGQGWSLDGRLRVLSAKPAQPLQVTKQQFQVAVPWLLEASLGWEQYDERGNG